jgi:hypothetical protein
MIDWKKALEGQLLRREKMREIVAVVLQGKAAA